MACVLVQEVCIRAGERKPWAFDWTLRFANKWRANAPYPATTRIRPSTLEDQVGYEFESSGGQSDGLLEPRWKKGGVLNGTVDTQFSKPDGSILWTPRELSYASLIERIDDVEYEVPAGISLDEDDIIDEPGMQATPFVVYNAQETDEQLDIVCRVTTTLGHKYDAILRVTVDP
jgi:hypothetical protein